MLRRLLLATTLSAYSLHGQLPRVVDVPNRCPYRGYITTFATPTLEEDDPHGETMTVPWWGAGSLQAFRHQHYHLPMQNPWSFAVGAGTGMRTGHWRIQTAAPFPEVILQAGTNLSNKIIPVPSATHLLQVHVDVWLETVDARCQATSRFVAESHPTGRVQHLVHLATGASASATYDARMETVFEELPGANSAWRVRSVGAGGQVMAFETGTVTTPAGGVPPNQGGYTVTWTSTTSLPTLPNGTTFAATLPKYDARHSTELHAIHVTSMTTQAMVQTGTNGGSDFATVHLGLFECAARARSCWGGTPHASSPEPQRIVPPRHRPLSDRQTPHALKTNHADRTRLNCLNLDGFRASF